MKRSVPALALLVVVAALAVHARILAGQTWNDVAYHTAVAPPRLEAAAQVQRGVLPRWWDGTGWGVPLLAEPSHGAADPILWVAATPRALDLVLVLHVAWLALGIALWARRAGATQLGAIAGALLALTTGVVSSAAMRGALPGLAMLPWVGWAALGIAHADLRSRRAHEIATLLLGLFVGLVALAGSVAALIDAVAIAVVAGDRAGMRRRLALGLAGGLAIGCIQWLPALALHVAGAEENGIGLARLVELVVPGAFGASDPARAVAAIGGGARDAWPSLYVGAPLLALAFVYHQSTRERVLAIGLAALALIVGRGGWPAIAGAPEVHAGALVIVLAVRAARGAELLVVGDRRARIALGIAAGVVALATWCLVALRDPALPAIDRALVDGTVGVLAMALAALLARRPALRYAALALAIVPGAFALRSTAPTADAAVLGRQPAWVTDGLAAIPRPPRRVYRPEQLLTSDSDGALVDAIETLAGASAARAGIAAARSDDPARSPDEAAAWAASSHGGGQLLERFTVGLAILPLSVVETRNLRELDRRGGWALAQYPTSPAAVTVSDWTWVADAAAAFKLLFPPDGTRGVPLDRAVLIGAVSGAAPDPAGVQHATTCDVQRWEPGAIDLACGPPNRSYAVVSSSAAPGWHVDVDGVDVPWVIADGLRRAVYLDLGKHSVQWRYRAPGLTAGLVLAALGIALLGALGLRSWRARP